MKIETLKTILKGERDSLINFSQDKYKNPEFMSLIIETEINTINHVLELINLDFEELRDD